MLLNRTKSKYICYNVLKGIPNFIKREKHKSANVLVLTNNTDPPFRNSLSAPIDNDVHSIKLHNFASPSIILPISTRITLNTCLTYVVFYQKTFTTTCIGQDLYTGPNVHNHIGSIDKVYNLKHISNDSNKMENT